MVPEGDFNCRPTGPQMAEICFQKAPPAKICPKRAVSQWAQKGILIAGPRARQLPKFASKRLPARIWPKTAVSQWSQKGIQRAVSQWSQKGILIAGPRARKWQNFASKRPPGQDLPQKGRFPMDPEGDFNCRPTGPPIAEICFQKAPG